MIAGVSTACFYPDHTEDALRFLAKGGVRRIEVFLNCASELAPSYLRALREITDREGAGIVAVHPYSSFAEGFLFFSRYDRRLAEGRELYRRYYEAAGLLGAEIVVFHGNHAHAPLEEELYFERYGWLTEDAKAAGVQLCHENVSYCQGSSPEFFGRLVRAIPGAGLVFDLKQAVRAGQDPLRFVTETGENIRHVHISDNREGRDCLPPGQGSFNIAGLLEDIGKKAPNAHAIVEVYHDSFAKNVEIIASYQHVCATLSTIG